MLAVPGDDDQLHRPADPLAAQAHPGRRARTGPTTQFGAINSAFQGAYAVSLLVFGWFVDRFGTKIGYAASIVAWSLAAIGHALVGSVGGFRVARVALGLGEGGNFPAAIKAVALWFPKRERAFATSLFNAGTNVGAIIAPAIVPWMAFTWGWQSAFVAGRYRRASSGCCSGFPFYDVAREDQEPDPSELAHIRSDLDDERDSRQKVGWCRSAALPADLVVHRRQVPDRPGLVVLPDLAARLLQGHPRPRHQEELGPPGHHLRDHHRAQHRRAAG